MNVIGRLLGFTPAERQPEPTEWHPVVGDPIVGWRIWRVERRHGVAVLSGIWCRAHWPMRRPMRAYHYHGAKRHAERNWAGIYRDPSHAPCRGVLNAGTGCGIHATKHRDGVVSAWHHTAGDGIIAVGSVSLWGRVQRHEQGFRAQYAYPREVSLLAVGDDEKADVRALADELAENYGVKVRVHGDR